MISTPEAHRPAKETAIGGSRAPQPVRESTYAWDLGTDALHWSKDAAECLGIAALGSLTTGRLFAARLVPESMTSRESAIRAGGHDAGAGVPYQANYGLIVDPDDREAAIVWIDDRGRWYADAAGRPGRAEGRVRRIVLDLGAAPPDIRSPLLGRTAFIDHVERKLAAMGRAPTPFAILVGGFANGGTDDDFAAAITTLRGQMRSRDLLARLAADRLSLLLEACNANQMGMAADRLLVALATPATAGFRFGGVVVPRDGRTSQALLAQADRALAAAFVGDTSLRAEGA